MIPKRLIFIWLGGELPDYGKFCIETFRKVNLEFEVMLVHEPNMDNIQSQDLKDCIALTKDSTPSIYKHTMSRNWAKMHLSSKIGKLVALSDAFRLYLLNKYGGIYLDIDTFPTRPFDDHILQYENGFVVNYKPDRYDIFFIGMTAGCVDAGLVQLPTSQNKKWFREDVYKIIYYEKLWQKLYLSQYNAAREKFFNCRLAFGETAYNRKLVPQYYIDHFRKETWNA